MSKKIKLIFNIIATILYGVAFFSFFFDFIYVWILGVGKIGSYKGYEVALNFDGMPTNLGTLFPLVMCLGLFLYGLFSIIKGLITLKKEPKKNKKYHPLLSAIIFALFPLVTFFLILSTSSMLELPAPKRYGGYYQGTAIYLVAYFSLIGGIMFFVTESGIFAKKDDPALEVVKVEEEINKPAKVEAPKVESPKVVDTKTKPQIKKEPFKLRCKKCGTILMSNEKKCPHCQAEVNPTNMIRLIPKEQLNKK